METKLRILIQDKNSGSPFFQKMLLKFVKRSTLNMVQDETIFHLNLNVFHCSNKTNGSDKFYNLASSSPK